MEVNKALELLSKLESETDKKAEKKRYNCFIRILSSLKNREFTESKTQLIEEKLSSLNLEEPTENRRKYYSKKCSEFVAFLKNEFSFTTEKYYTELGMVMGMSFGMAIGISTGIAIDPVFGTSIGLSVGIGVGMVIGMAYGARKDAEAKRQGKVI